MAFLMGNKSDRSKRSEIMSTKRLVWGASIIGAMVFLVAVNAQQWRGGSQESQRAKLQAVQAVQNVIMNIYNMNTQNYEQKLARAKQFFTDKGWQALDMAKLVEGVKNNRYAVQAQFNQDHKPRVGQDNQAQGRTWIVQQPFNVVYQINTEDGVRKHTQSLMATAMVQAQHGQVQIARIRFDSRQKAKQQRQGE
jgi:hypothetical protein